MLHTLRPHTPFCLEMEYKIVRSPRLQGIRRCAPHALQSGTSNYYIHYSTCAVPNTVHCILYTLQLQLEKKKNTERIEPIPFPYLTNPFRARV